MADFDRERVRQILADNPGGSMRFVELAARAGVPVALRPAFKRFLKEMIADDVLSKFAGSRYRLPRSGSTVQGRPLAPEPITLRDCARGKSCRTPRRVR